MTTSMKRHSPQAFLVIGIVFLVLGLSDHTAFIALGAAFIAISAALSRREKRNDLNSESGPNAA